MADVGAYPPSPGVVPNFVDPDSQDKTITSLHSTGLILITISVAMRFYTRHFITHRLGWDDWFCLVAFILTAAYSGLTLESQKYGYGRHIWDVRAIYMEMLLKLLLASELIYIPLLILLKSSFFLFYGRIFSPSITVKMLNRFGIASCLIFYTAIFFRSVFLCNPVRKLWIPLEPGSCLNSKIMPYASGFFNVISDIYILILPMPFVWSLKMKTPRKLRLMAAFGVGSFVCAASIIRLVITFQTIGDPDVTWQYATLNTWASVEVFVGIICACSLALPAFLDRHFPQGLGSYLSKLSYYFSSRNRDNESTEHSTSMVHPSERLPYTESASPKRRTNGYAELGGGMEMSTMRGDMAHRSPDFSNETTVEGGSGKRDVEALVPTGIMKTVDLQLS